MREIDENRKLQDKYKMIFMATIAIIILAIQIWEVVFFRRETPVWVNITNILIIFIYLLISISDINKIYKIKNANICIETLEAYNKTLKTLYDDTRAFKHDFNNIIQTIGGYALTGDIEGLKIYHKEILKDCNNMNNLEILNPNLFNNPAIYSLINNKVYMARNLGIEININVLMDLNKINMKIYEITRILGILLDNAIEASKECDNKIINVEFIKNDTRNMQLVKIDNTYNEKDVNIEKIFEKEYSSKPNNTGIGLWEVRQILTKNKNLNLFTTKDDEYFKQQLEIYA